MRVLLVGDSHTVGPYGDALESLFASAGASVVRIARTGARAGTFLGETWDGPFDLAIVSLGTNDVAQDMAGADLLADRIRKLADRIPASVVFWVGPPAFSTTAARSYNPIFARKDLNTRVAELYDAAIPLFGDLTIDPRGVTAPYVPAADIHLGPEGGAAWARFVFDRVRGALATGRTERPSIARGYTGAVLGFAAGAVALLLVALWRRRR